MLGAECYSALVNVVVCILGAVNVGDINENDTRSDLRFYRFA